MSCTRQQYVDTAKRYVGYNETDGSWLVLRDAYDKALTETDVIKRWGTRNLKFATNWHWCAMFCGSIAYFAGCTDVVPFEMSVWSLQQFAKRGLNGAKWVGYKDGNANTVNIGDLVVYDWSGGHSDTDHVGIVASVSNSGFTTIEGNSGGTGSGDNYKGKVVTRSVNWGASTLTGFIHCNFANTTVKPKEHTETELKQVVQEVLNGKWGNGVDRKNRLTQAGYNYDVVQAMVNEAVKNKNNTKVEYETYTVVKGDTMYKIAQKYGLTLKQLIAMNPQISNPNLIYAGNKINVKVKQAVAETPTTHKVVKGDTFESIAKKYNISVAKLAELNVGITLKVR